MNEVQKILEESLNLILKELQNMSKDDYSNFIKSEISNSPIHTSEVVEFKFGNNDLMVRLWKRK